MFQGWVHRLEPLCDLAVPCSLDLDAWINEPPSDSESEDEIPKAIFHDEEQRHAKQQPPKADEEELARVSAITLGQSALLEQALNSKLVTPVHGPARSCLCPAVLHGALSQLLTPELNFVAMRNFS